jgi:cytidylate kinase
VDAFREGAFLESDYLRALVRTVRSIGEAGSAVLLGRGAPYILPPERTLRVLVVAPREARVLRLAKARGLEPAEADRELAREDEDRKRFLEHHFRVDPDDATRYDLAVNTASLSREAACELVLAAYFARFGSDATAERPATV